MEPIAHISSLFPTKFGIPRQAGIVNTPARILFEPQYRNAEAVRGLEEFDYIWLIWQFSEAVRQEWSPTVRPPRLGGNRRMGVFATRSPFRPNPLGLSSVRLLKVEPSTPEGPVLHIEGADLMDGTPIYDIKPYLPYVDSHAEARGGFTDEHGWRELKVEMPDALRHLFSTEDATALEHALALDPRPHYHDDETRLYGMPFKGYDISFSVVDGVLRIENWVKK